ncbi:transportin-3-like [Glandiceps talaboti]
MEPEPTLETVVQAVQSLYHSPDPSAKEKASNWLGDFQRSVHAWQIADQLLRLNQNVESSYFAAQTMRTKIQYAFHELPADSHTSLRDSLINHIELLSADISPVIMTQLCLALSDLALQMVLWKNASKDMMQRFGNDPKYLPFLLEVLTVMPEEVNSRTLRLGANRRQELTQDFSQSVTMMISLLSNCLEKTTETRLLTKVFKCLASWFNLGVIPADLIVQSKVIMAPFQVLLNRETTSGLHEAATDCICSALYVAEDLSRHFQLAQALYQGVLLLPEPYHMSVAEEDIDKSINFCRIFTELAESFLEVMIKMPGQGLGSLASLDLLLTCVGHHQYEVAEITFNFWYRLSEQLYKDDNMENNEMFRPYIQRLITALCIHCQMDPDHEGIPDEKDDFGDFRLRVSELIKDVVFLVGSSTCFQQVFQSLAVQGAGASWDITEAALFVMCAVAKNILPNEGEVVPHVVQAIINLPKDAHIAVRYTSTHLIGQLGEWIETHTEYLDPILHFLMAGLQHADLASAAAHSIQSICDVLRNHMKDHFDGLLQITRAIDSFNLSHDAAIGLIKGAAIILTQQPIDKVTDGVRQLVTVQLHHLSQLVKGDGPKDSKDPTVWLDRLSAVFRYANPTINNGQIHPCQPVLLESWPVLSEVMSKYQADERIIERCCRCLRFALRSIGKGAAVMLQPLVSQMVVIYQAHHHSCFLYLGSILVDEFGKESGCVQGLIDMLQAFCGPTFELLHQNGFRNHPDTVDDLFRLAARFLQRCAVPFLQSQVISPLIQCALAGVTLDHRDANASVMKFFRDLVYTATGNEHRDDYEVRKSLVHVIFNQHGEQLMNNLMIAVVFHLPVYMVPEIGDVIYELMLFDRPSVCRWLEVALKALPTETRPGAVNATHKQLTEFHKKVTSAEEQNSVSHALRDFARLFR